MISAHFACSVLAEFFLKDDPVSVMLALFLLDMMMINCGYPVHLAVSKRDFLNKLVYRFPPSPSFRLDKAHEHVLYLIQKWSMSLCEHSPHKLDFGNIRLMHSLLRSRGFPLPSEIPADEIKAILITHDMVHRFFLLDKSQSQS